MPTLKSGFFYIKMFLYLCYDMQNIVNELINNSIKGIDTYRWNTSTWLIFSEDYQWVVELTDEGTLWFNYRFFEKLLRYVSLSVTDGTKFITAWAEGYFSRENVGWKVFDSTAIHRENKAVSVVNRGIKKTEEIHYDVDWNVRIVMNKGVKETRPNVLINCETDYKILFDYRCNGNNLEINKIVDEGIKNTWADMIPGEYNWRNEFHVDKVIYNGKIIS
jgi:hypothetical protein